MPKVRQAHVAGQFYPDDEASLLEFLKGNLDRKAEKKEAGGLLMPHAGYVYSGETAALTISRVILKDSVLILGPNHTGAGKVFSLMSEGCWTTPLGNVEIDQDLATCLREACPELEECEEAHWYEHSIEVELPFLQYLNPKGKIVPISVGLCPLQAARNLGEKIGRFLSSWPKVVLLLASSDMNHYENDEVTFEKDQFAIEALVRADAEQLATVVRKKGISMCGFIPVYIMLTALRLLGTTRGELVDHRTSAQASGDSSRVVGYAGMVFY